MAKTEWTQFENALLDASLEEFADIPAEDSIDLVLTEDFELQSQALLEKARRGKVPRLGKALRSALLIAAILAALATAAMAIPTVRKEIIKFFAVNVGTHHVVQFDPEQAATAPKYIEKVYKPTYIPKEFYLEEEDVCFGWVYQTWKHDREKDWYIFYHQQPLPVASNGGPDSEHTTSKYIIWGDYRVFCVEEDIWRFYSWTDNAYYYKIVCNADIPEEEIYNVFASIKEDPDAVIDYH